MTRLSSRGPEEPVAKIPGADANAIKRRGFIMRNARILCSKAAAARGLSNLTVESDGPGMV